MVITGREKVVSKFVEKWKKGYTTIKVSENNKNKRKRKSKGNRARMGQKIWPKKWKFSWINSKKETQKLQLIRKARQSKNK